MNTLGMFARRPVPGKTKTRLAAAIGDESAAELYAAFLDDLLSRLALRTEHCVVAVTPPDQETHLWFSSRVTKAMKVLAQPECDLGGRIQWFFEEAFCGGVTRAVLIGSDSPDIPDELLNAAFDRLKYHDVVLGPAADGGYVLVGMKRPLQGLFDNISWSSPTTLTETIDAAERNKLSVDLLPLWYDIDKVESLGTLLSMQRSSNGNAGFFTVGNCPATQRCLAALWPEITRRIAMNQTTSPPDSRYRKPTNSL